MKTLSFKSYLRILSFVFLCSYLSIFAFVQYIDPSGRRANNTGENWKLFRSDILTTKKYIDFLEEKPYSLVFGTSRSLLLSPEFLHDDIINLYSIYGNPNAVLRFLKRLNSKQVKNIKHIYYLIDFHAFNGKQDFNELDYSKFLERWQYVFKTFGVNSIFSSIDRIYLNAFGSPDFHISDYGYKVMIQDRFANPNFHATDRYKEEVHATQEFKEETVALLHDIDLFVKERNIPTTYFTGTLPVDFLKIMDPLKLRKLQDTFLQQIEGYYELHYIQGISEDITNFSNMTHLNAKGMQKVFGTGKYKDHYVTVENIESSSLFSIKL